MSNSTSPSKLRRMGREAFYPGEDPMMVQPWKRKTFGYDYYLPHWLEGWEQAREDYAREQQENPEDQEIEMDNVKNALRLLLEDAKCECDEPGDVCRVCYARRVYDELDDKEPEADPYVCRNMPVL